MVHLLIEEGTGKVLGTDASGWVRQAAMAGQLKGHEMLSQDAMVEHMTASLARGERFTSPYALTLFQPFSDEVYAAMLANLPEDRFYEPLMHKDAIRPDGTSTRLVLSVNDQAISHLPEEQRKFWSEFNRIMRSRTMTEVFLRHMEPELTARFKKPIEDIPCFPGVRLGRDADGYQITPHPDSPKRVYTAQVYLADDDSQKDIGTIVYERLADGSFREVRRLPFLPNTAFCFARTDTTYHGVEPVRLAKARQNLHISVFREEPGF